MLITFDRDNSRVRNPQRRGTSSTADRDSNDSNDGNSEGAGVDWRSIRSIHLLDSSGLLNQRVDVGPGEYSSSGGGFSSSSSASASSSSSGSLTAASHASHIPFHPLEQDFLIQKGELLIQHYNPPSGSSKASNHYTGFQSWAQIAVEFNLTFSGKILVALDEEDDCGGDVRERKNQEKGKQGERPWRSRQALKDEWRRLSGQPGRPVVGREDTLYKDFMMLREGEGQEVSKGKRDQGLRGLRLVLPREGGFEKRMSLIPRAVRGGYFRR